MSSPRKRRGGQAIQLVAAQGLHLGGVHGHSRNAGAHAHMGVVHGCLLGPLAKDCCRFIFQMSKDDFIFTTVLCQPDSNFNWLLGHPNKHLSSWVEKK